MNNTELQRILSTPVEQLSLDELRAQIDQHDSQIVELLKTRLQVVEKVGEYKKTHQNDGCYMRPGREATMVRELAQQLDHYPQEAICQIWRMIISSSVQSEQIIHFHAFTGDGNDHTMWLGREYFGSFTAIKDYSDFDSFMTACDKEKNVVAIIPDLGTLGADHLKYFAYEIKRHKLAIFAEIPFIKSNDKKAFVCAKLAAEETGNDISLFYSEDKGLIQKEGFYQQSDNAIYLGSYAKAMEKK